jgi:hypothetical protein
VTHRRGVVISLHRLGATVRLEDGTLAAVPAGELGPHASRLASSQRRSEPLLFAVDERGRHRVARLADSAPPATSLHDSAFEVQMRRYLKETEEWAPPDQPPPAERHFIRKKRRAAYFEARAKSP